MGFGSCTAQVKILFHIVAKVGTSTEYCGFSDKYENETMFKWKVLNLKGT